MSRHSDLKLAGNSFTLRNARVPSCFLRAIPDGVTVDDEGCVLVDLVVERGIVKSVRAGGAAPADGPQAIDLRGRQVWATLVDAHTHLDKGQIIPRTHPDGTLDGGVRLTMADRKNYTEEDIAARMRFGLRAAYVHGVSAIRTHLDAPNVAHAQRSWKVFGELRKEWAGRLELQAVSLTSLSILNGPEGAKLADLAAEHDGILGGVTDHLGAYGETSGERLDALFDTYFRLASERGIDVDLHADQTDDVAAFTLPRIAQAVTRNKYAGHCMCSHCVTLAVVPEDEAADAIAQARDAGLMFVTLPASMMYLQDRKRGRTPRWRGVTAAQEIAGAGCKIALGTDNCRDAWYPFGDHDMLETVQFAVKVYQLDDPITDAIAMAGPVASDIMRTGSHGRIVEGGPADLILLSARTLNEMMCRPQSDRIVVRNGVQVTDKLPDYEELDATLLR